MIEFIKKAVFCNKSPLVTSGVDGARFQYFYTHIIYLYITYAVRADRPTRCDSIRDVLKDKG